MDRTLSWFFFEKMTTGGGKKIECSVHLYSSPCLDVGFQYTLIRNNRPKNFGVEYWALPGSNSPWRPCILYYCYAEKPFDFGFEVQSCCNFPSRKVKVQKSKINLEQNWPYVWLGLHHRTTVEKPTLSSDSIHVGKFAREKSHKVPLICH